MKPRIARIAARIQVAIAFGTLPLAILAAAIAAPFDPTNAAFAGISVVVLSIALSSVGIPIIGLVISHLWLSDGD